MTSVRDSLDVDAALLAQLIAPLNGDAAFDPTMLLPLDDPLATCEPLHQSLGGSAASSGEEAHVSDLLLLEESDKLLELLDGHADDAQLPAPNSESGSQLIAGDAHLTGNSASAEGTATAAAAAAAVSAVSAAAAAAAGSTRTTFKPSRRRGSKPGSMRNPSRERLLNELEYLREQVVHLEEALKSAQDNSGRGAPHQATPEPTTSPCAGLGVISPAQTWERIAKRQLAGCERAMAENKRLRSMLAAQKQLVTGVEEKLYNWQRATAQHAIPPAAVTSGVSANSAVSAFSTVAGVSAAYAATESAIKTVRMEPGDDVVLEMLVSELDGTFSQMDEMFRGAGVYELPNRSYVKATTKTQSMTSGTTVATASATSNSSYPSTSGTTDSSLRSFVELVEVEVAPFEFEMWNHAGNICGAHRHASSDSILYEGSWDSTCTHAEKSRIKRVLNGVEMVFETLGAAKELELDNRVVMVWRNISKCEEHFPDMYVQEVGIFEASRLELPNSVKSTLERTVVQFEPKRFTSPLAAVNTDGHVMANLVMSAYKDEMDELDEMMESLMLDEMRKMKDQTLKTV